MATTPTIELEHAIGFSGKRGSLHYHSSSNNYIYPAGGCIVLNSLDDSNSQSFLRGHDQDITCLSMSRSGRLLASGQCGHNSDVLVWDYSSKSLRFRLSEHDYGVAAVGFSDDEQLLATVGVVEDSRLFVWDISTGNIVGTNQKLPSPVSALAWGGMHRDVKRRDTQNYQFVTAGDRITFWILNPMTGELTGGKAEYGTPMVRDYTCVDFSPDREKLYAGSTSGDFIIVGVKNRQILQFVTACACGVHSLISIKDGTFVGGGDGSLMFFNRKNIDSAHVQLQGLVSGISISDDKSELVAGTQNGFVYRMRLDLNEYTIRPLLLCQNHFGSVIQVAYACSSDLFATISDDGSIRIWDASDYSVMTKCFIQDAGKPTCLEYSADILLSGWTDGRIRCHSSDNGEELWVIDNAHPGGVSAVVLSNNQRFFVTGGSGGDVRVWDIRKRDLVSHLKEHSMIVTDLALFDDDLHVLSCSRDRNFLCWDLRNERRIASHTQRMGGINSITLSRDQKQVLTIGQEKKISYWDLRIEAPINIIHPAHAEEATCIAVAHNFNIIATGGADQLVKLWDFDTGKLLKDGIGHSGVVRSLKFSPDDRQLISVGNDGNIFVWNVYA